MILAVAGLVLLNADRAWAWGPAMHVGIASSVLDNLALLPAALAAVLARNRLAYLFGNIAADVVFAKRLSKTKQFCHHWSTAFRLLEEAGGEQTRAFACGYLTHLAADTVAHGKFVPHQIVVSGCGVNFGHLYWELRADAAEAESSWRLLEDVLDDDHDPHHEVLAGLITDTFLAYPLNRLLFKSMHALTIRREFRRTIDAWSRQSRWYLSDDLMGRYRAESSDRALMVLTDGVESTLLKEDPNGTSALMQLRVRRREIRRLRRRGMPVELRLLETSLGFSPTVTERSAALVRTASAGTTTSPR